MIWYKIRIMTDISPSNIQMSADAAQRICDIVSGKNDGAAILRLAVMGGGCSGFQYEFALEKQPKPDDLVITRNGATMVVDPLSLPYLEGAELDYVQEPIGSYFRVKNPNAVSGCGCGASFAV